MITALFTLDYEIHGNGEGDPLELIVEPTSRLLDLFDRYGVKLTIMADVAEIIKFREYHEHTGDDDFHYEAIAGQLRNAIERGHDVQLHLHPSYFNAHYSQTGWVQDWSEYNFAGLALDRMKEMIRIGKQFLEDLLTPTDPSYRCFVFRAANWSVCPSGNVISALVSNGIRIDTSVFKYGKRSGIVSFDYSNAHSRIVPWTVCDSDICRSAVRGDLIESPIYCERRWLGAFFSLNRIRRAFMSRSHRITGSSAPDGCNSKRGSIHNLWRSLSKGFSLIANKHPWKADFNQCTGGQLCRALARVSRRYDPSGDRHLPFVLIGHSKLFSKANQRSLETLMKYIKKRGTRFQFGTFRTKQCFDMNAAAR